MTTTRRPARITFALFLTSLAASCPAFAQDAPPAAPAATARAASEKTDAFGDKVDTAAQIRQQIASQITTAMGSPEWVPLGLMMLESHGKILGRLEKTAEIDLQCLRRYRQEYPEKTRAEHQAFLETPDGMAWERACLLDLISGPKADPELVDGLVASMEVGMMLPNFLDGIRKARERQGLTAVPELTPELEARLPEMVNEGFDMSNCLMGKVLEKLPIATLINEPASMMPIVQEVFQAGGCGFPAPKNPAPEDPS